jgi:uncharacterized protein YdaU (DUF1376 family)
MNEPRNGLFVEYCAKDFLDGTLSLDVWEELAYRRLVDMIYATNDKVKDDDKKLAWATKTGSRWPKIKVALIDAGKIEVVDGRITNARCQKELEKSAKKIAQKRVAGHASAEARKSPENKETTPTAADTAVPTAEATAAQLTTNPITQVSKNTEASASVVAPPAPAPTRELAVVDKAKKPRAKARARLSEDWVLPMEWGQWAMGEGASEQLVRKAADRFKSHWIATGKPMADWKQTWFNWIRNDLERNSNVKPSRGNRTADLLDGLAGAFSDCMDTGPVSHNVVPLRLAASAF